MKAAILETINAPLTIADVEVPDLLRVDPESEGEQLARLRAFKEDRDQALVAQFRQRLARQEQDSCFGKFHEDFRA